MECADVAAAFEKAGLPSPGSVPLMPLAYQIAQKLHAVTGGDRVRDLVDLQAMLERREIDLALTRHVCVRLFAYRKQQSWPPVFAKREGWDDGYAADAEGLGILDGVDEAVAWANGLIAAIDDAKGLAENRAGSVNGKESA